MFFKCDPIVIKRFVRIIFLLMVMIVEATSASVKANAKSKIPHIVFLISEDPDNYEAHLTIPAFAKSLSESGRYKTSVLQGSSKRTSYRFPNFEILKEADLVVVFARRLALPKEQMDILKQYLKNGGGLVGIRTANHAFTLLKGEVAETGFVQWPEFVSTVLGCENRGYGPATAKTEVKVNESFENHEILKDIGDKSWVSDGNLYLVAPLLDRNAKVLLHGLSDQKSQPIAWTRQSGKSRVFYTSLGYPSDFKNQNFIKLLENAMDWTLNRSDKH